MVLWLLSVLVQVGILPVNKEINSRGIVGIFNVTFGNDSGGRRGYYFSIAGYTRGRQLGFYLVLMMPPIRWPIVYSSITQ